MADERTLIICEPSTGFWKYHIREVGPEGPKYGGGAGPALCGRKMGWDMEGWALEEYGVWNPDHLPVSWCQECKRLAGL